MHTPLVGDDVKVPVLDGSVRRHVNLDCAATTPASLGVALAVERFLPWYSSVHRGTGAKSRYSSERYEQARETLLRFVGADPATHVALFPRNTTEALNVVAFRLGLCRDDVVLTTEVEHHANLLPWRRFAQLRYVRVDAHGVFDLDEVTARLDEKPVPKVLAITGASNVTGWMPALPAIAAAARDRGIRVVVDAAQLAPHRPINMSRLGVDLLALSGHKMYAPFGAGALIGPRSLFAEGEPLLLGGGAIEAVGLDDVVWAPPPDRDEAGSPNVVGVVALEAAAREFEERGWATTIAHERALARRLDAQLADVPGLWRYGSTATDDRLAVAAFNLDGIPHGLLASRLAHEFGVAVRSGCFCAHPYMTRLLELGPEEVLEHRENQRAGRRARLPGAVRASAGLGTRPSDIDALGDALRAVAATPEIGRTYAATPDGDFDPPRGLPALCSAARA